MEAYDGDYASYDHTADTFFGTGCSSCSADIELRGPSVESCRILLDWSRVGPDQPMLGVVRIMARTAAAWEGSARVELLAGE